LESVCLRKAPGEGNSHKAEAYARAGDFIEGNTYKQWFRKLTPHELARITITGISDHTEISNLLPLASVSIVPGKWAEPFGMVAVEAMAAGVLPLMNNHAGLRDVVDEVKFVDPELAEIMSLNREHFVAQLPEKIVTALQFLFPHGYTDNKPCVVNSDKFPWVNFPGMALPGDCWDSLALR
jgi:glycosyltransferase involved in cell wall biosynthesis